MQYERCSLEIEPLACPTCQARLRIVAFITDPRVVDRILAHLRRTRPGLFPPPRASPAVTPTLCRADADGVLFAQDFPPDV